MMCSLPNETSRRGGETSNTGFTSVVLPENKNYVSGVSPDNAPTEDDFSKETKEESSWFLMRVSYGREEKAKEILELNGVEVFLPMTQKERGGVNKIVKKGSLIPNLLFVRSTENTLNQYVGKPGLEFLHYYYVPNYDSEGRPIGLRGIKPLIIPDDQMASFRRWHDVEDPHKMFMPKTALEFNPGERVRIIEGKFKGIIGYVCRVKRQRRVGVHIEGLGIIVTAYIPKDFLKKE